uniref:Protein E8^E2C n=1 Tax=Fringilla coelebs papillomavirus TaxID=197771 RepID=A0A193DQZ6_FCPV|nr:E2 [Etapapillomavirus 1]
MAAKLLQKLLQLQERESQLLEQETHTLKQMEEYWEGVRKQQIILTYAATKGLKYLGLTRVPSQVVSEHMAKDAILMQMLITSISKSRFSDLDFNLTDFMPQTVKKVPEGVKLGAKTVRVTYGGDPDTETEYVYWGRLLKHDPLTDRWEECSGGVDLAGIYYECSDGEGKSYTSVWSNEAALHGRDSWFVEGIGHHPTLVSGEEDVVDLSLLPDSPVHESTRIGLTPSPPQLSRYSVSGAGSAPSKRTNAVVNQPAAPAPERPARRLRSSKDKGPKRKKRRGNEASTGVDPDQVGSRHTSAPKHSGGRTAVERLIDDAVDPVGLCFEGYTHQVKTIRRRLYATNLRYQRVSSTWHWVGEDKNRSKIIVLFDSKEDRDNFAKNFYTGASGVRVFHVSMQGV